MSSNEGKAAQDAWRWGLVTFAGCITSGVLAANYEFPFYIFIAFMFSAAGGIAISMRDL